MPNVIQIRDKEGNALYPITDSSLVIGLKDGGIMENVMAWDGTSAPTVANIPAGVQVEYNSTTYTGTLAASGTTSGYIYLVASATQQGEYDRYIVNAAGGSYTWVALSSTQIVSPTIADNLTTNDATKALSAKQGKVLNDELNQLGQEKTMIGAGNTNVKLPISLTPGHTYRLVFQNPAWDKTGVTSTSVNLFGIYNYYNNASEKLVNEVIPASGVKPTIQPYYDFTVPSLSDYVSVECRATSGIRVYFRVADLSVLGDAIKTNQGVKDAISEGFDLGHNLYKNSFSSPTTSNGITFTKVSDNDFTIGGTASANVNVLVAAKSYVLDVSKTHRIKVDMGGVSMPDKIWCYFGGYKADGTTQIQGTPVKADGQWHDVTYSQEAVTSRAQFHIESGTAISSPITVRLFDVVGESVAEMTQEIANLQTNIRRGGFYGNGTAYTVFREFFDLIPGEAYVLSLSNWDFTGLSAGSVIFEIVNFTNETDFTRLESTTALAVGRAYRFVVPKTCYKIRIGGRLSANTAVKWELTQIPHPVNEKCGAYDGERISVNPYRVTRWFNLSSYGTLSLVLASQGFEIYGDNLFQNGSISGSATKNSIVVVDLVKQVILGQVEFTDTTYHMNNVNAGAFYAVGDKFPLLYISQCYGGHKCAVIRLSDEVDSYTLIQEITYAGTAHFVGSNAYDWFVDSKNGFLYAFGNASNNNSAIIEIVRFALPSLSSASVSLSDSDVLDSFTVNVPGVYQGSRLIGGKLFAPCGDSNGSYLSVIDLGKKAIVSQISFGSEFGEIEACAPYNGKLVINNNSYDPIYRVIDFS